MAYSYTFTGKSSATSLTSQFYLQNFYKNNRDACKTANRGTFADCELVYEDSRALKRAVSALSSFSYSEEDNGENMVNTILAYVDTYNNAIDSTSSEDSESYRQNKKLQALSKKYEDELKDIGISIDDDGKLSVNEDILSGSTHKEVKKIFGDDSDYMKSIRSISKRMNATSYEEIYTLMTGNGGKLNITI